jgi:hypothetical protein
MNIVLQVVRAVIVYYQHKICHVEAASSDRSRYHYITNFPLEIIDGVVTVCLDSRRSKGALNSWEDG